MSLKIFHTADLHLGLKFARYPDVQSELSEARFKTLENLIGKANSERCDLFVVAGDLFDRVTVARGDIRKCADILNEFNGVVIVLPGNHDYSSSQSDLWGHFGEHAGDRVCVLDRKAPFPLQHYDLDAVLYSGPCHAKHSSENAVGWIDEVPKDENQKYHIGVAHGNIEGLGLDEDRNYYPMTRAELLSCELDLWLLGHIHVPFPEEPLPGERIYYPGTPEPDGFDCKHSGHAWIIELDDRNRIDADSLSCGEYLFTHDEADLQDESDLGRVQRDYTDTDQTKTLIKLKLTGRLSRDAYAQLDITKSIVRDRVFYLQWDDSEVAAEITPDVIDREFTQDSFPHKLLTELTDGEENAEALQIAYEMIQEVKE